MSKETLTYKNAITRGMADALANDDTVFMLGEDIGAAGGVFKTTEGLFERFGGDRVRDTPISEQAIVGAAVGASTQGYRPIAEIMFADFAAVCFDQIANQLAKYRYMTGGQISVPVTIRMANGLTGGFGAQHSQTAENWFLNIPGLKIVTPATPADAYGLLRTAVEDDDPVLYFEHKGLFNTKGELGDDPQPIPFGVADVVRAGDDVTVVATQMMRHRAEEAAVELAEQGISVELIDPRTLVPFDFDRIRQSIEKTNRLVVVQECTVGGSWGATLVAEVVEQHLELLDSPPTMVSGDPTPLAYSGDLEQAWLPTGDRIVDAVKKSIEY